jgi:hypothetical protein
MDERPPRRSSGKLLIDLDGHSSHVSDNGILNFANENYILLLCLYSYSHSTHYLQPLGRKFFKSLKHYFHEACQTWTMANEQQKITRLQFGQLLSKAWVRSAITGKGVSGFRVTDIHRFDPSAIPEHTFSTSQEHFDDEARQLQSETHSFPVSPSQRT